MRSIRRNAAVLLLLMAAGCAHRRPVADLKSLKEANHTFFLFLRWSDLRGASQLLAAGGREWLDKALDARDDENLKVTDCELDDLQLKPEGGSGSSVTRVTWHRLPSVTTRSERVTVEWIEKGGIWFVKSIQGGPLPLAAPAEPDASKP